MHPVPCHRRHGFFEVEQNLALDDLGADFRDEFREIDRTVGQAVFLGLDPAEGDEILDQPLHPSRLVVHDLQEACAERRVFARFLAERLDIAEDRGERGAQFVAGIGDEIDPHTLGGIIAGLVDQVDDALTAGSAKPPALRDSHLPALVERAETNQIDRFHSAGFKRADKPFGSGGMADGEAHILPDDMPAEQCAGRCIGLHYAALRHDQDRLDDCFQHVANIRAQIRK